MSKFYLAIKGEDLEKANKAKMVWALKKLKAADRVVEMMREADPPKVYDTIVEFEGVCTCEIDPDGYDKWVGEKRDKKKLCHRNHLSKHMSFHRVLKTKKEVRVVSPDEIRGPLEKSIELDCPPGNPRPGDLIEFVTKDLDLPKKETCMRLFGNWKWDFEEVADEHWMRIQPTIKKRIEDLYNQGVIRYGSW